MICLFWIGATMKRVGGRVVLAAVLLAGCCAEPAAEPRWPSSLGSVPDDVPLPPGMPLDPDGDSWIRSGPEGRKARICLAGSYDRRDLAAFFGTHARLARWKPEAGGSRGGASLVFRKGGESLRILLEDRAGGGAKVRALLNLDEDMEGRDARN
jgi:hypothetical protein